MIIEHITDNDLYKISMQQAVWHQYPNAVGRYELAVRTKNPAFPLADIAREINDEVHSMSALRLQNDEYVFMRQKLPWLKDDYLDWLAHDFRFIPENIQVYGKSDGTIRLSTHGKWVDDIPYEVPVLAIIEELYMAKAYGITPEEAQTRALDILKSKVHMISDCHRLMFTDFGTRRRYSKAIQDFSLGYLKDNCPNCIGTSNVWFAKKYDMKVVGTVAHEWFMAHLALVDRLDQAQKRALHVWLQEYGEDLGTALTDTFTTQAFWRDFDAVLARGFSGVRHDSGDPFQFGHDAIEHYRKLGIDPRLKNIIFSDALTFPMMISLFGFFAGLIGIGFGIGTNLMNDLGMEPLSIVVKLMELNGIPLVKISDAPGKTMGDANMVREVCKAFQVPT